MGKTACSILLILAVILQAAPAPAAAVRIRVAQESRPGLGYFDANVLGHIDAYYEKEKAASDFYSYQAVSRYSFNGPHPRLQADTSHLFFVTTREGFSLFIVHDKPNDADGGAAVMRDKVTGDPNGARVLVFDDPYSDWDSFRAAPGSGIFPPGTNGFPAARTELSSGRWRGDGRFSPNSPFTIH